MLDISCPGVYPGVLLWPICHPYMKALAPSRVENAPLTARLSQLFSFAFSDIVDEESIAATSLKAWFLPPSLLPPWSSSIRWVIPCSHVREFARRLGR
jgi:hypothetical protein